MPNGSYGWYELHPEWLKEFPWISGRPGDEYVYCKLCKKNINVHGRSSLRSHANGDKHSNLEKASKRKRKKSLKVPSSALRSTKSCSASSRINNFFINAPNASTLPDIQQTFSSRQGSRISSTSSQRIPSSSSGHGNFVTETSPSVSSHHTKSTFSTSSRRIPSSSVGHGNFATEPSPSVITTFDYEPLSRADFGLSNSTKQEFKQAFQDMLFQQKLKIETDISNFLNEYRQSFSPRCNTMIEDILDQFKTSAENVRNNTKKDLFHVLRSW